MEASLGRSVGQVETQPKESISEKVRSSVRDNLSPNQQSLLALVESHETYLANGYSDLAGNLPPNEINRNLELLVRLGLIKAVSIPVTPGKLGQVFYTKAYRSLQAKDNVRELDLKALPEAPEE
jgi:hypothetical protein